MFGLINESMLQHVLRLRTTRSGISKVAGCNIFKLIQIYELDWHTLKKVIVEPVFWQIVIFGKSCQVAAKMIMFHIFLTPLYENSTIVSKSKGILWENSRQCLFNKMEVYFPGYKKMSYHKSQFLFLEVTFLINPIRLCSPNITSFSFIWMLF